MLQQQNRAKENDNAMVTIQRRINMNGQQIIWLKALKQNRSIDVIWSLDLWSTFVFFEPLDATWRYIWFHLFVVFFCRYYYWGCGSCTERSFSCENVLKLFRRRIGASISIHIPKNNEKHKLNANQTFGSGDNSINEKPLGVTTNQTSFRQTLQHLKWSLNQHCWLS